MDIRVYMVANTHTHARTHVCKHIKVVSKDSENFTFRASLVQCIMFTRCLAMGMGFAGANVNLWCTLSNANHNTILYICDNQGEGITLEKPTSGVSTEALRYKMFYWRRLQYQFSTYLSPQVLIKAKITPVKGYNCRIAAAWWRKRSSWKPFQLSWTWLFVSVMGQP